MDRIVQAGGSAVRFTCRAWLPSMLCPTLCAQHVAPSTAARLPSNLRPAGGNVQCFLVFIPSKGQHSYTPAHAVHRRLQKSTPAKTSCCKQRRLPSMRSMQSTAQRGQQQRQAAASRMAGRTASQASACLRRLKRAWGALLLHQQHRQPRRQRQRLVAPAGRNLLLESRRHRTIAPQTQLSGKPSCAALCYAVPHGRLCSVSGSQVSTVGASESPSSSSRIEWTLHICVHRDVSAKLLFPLLPVCRPPAAGGICWLPGVDDEGAAAASRCRSPAAALQRGASAAPPHCGVEAVLSLQCRRTTPLCLLLLMITGIGSLPRPALQTTAPQASALRGRRSGVRRRQRRSSSGGRTPRPGGCRCTACKTRPPVCSSSRRRRRTRKRKGAQQSSRRSRLGQRRRRMLPPSSGGSSSWWLALAAGSSAVPRPQRHSGRRRWSGSGGRRATRPSRGG